eukprot:TRINITY_DN26209_c0_g1_i2.p1 TRINITY_DN26209_c0_g1~~TRINITY_DN26209_c0_g1_i2.p1  ORF type:complete len:210 (+),score=68.60 TRINITY_DN26209_c0_g1_i2:41-631(+)
MGIEELDSSDPDDALVVEKSKAEAGQAEEGHGKAGSSEAHAASVKQRGSRKERIRKALALPPGWIRVESKSKPGAYYYAHPASKTTQAYPPAKMYAGLPEPDHEEEAEKSRVEKAKLEAEKKSQEEEASKKKAEAEVLNRRAAAAVLHLHQVAAADLLRCRRMSEAAVNITTIDLLSLSNAIPGPGILRAHHSPWC